MPLALNNNRGSVYSRRMKIEVPERWCLTGRGCRMWHRNLVLKNCWLPVMREMILHADVVKQVRPGGIVKR